MTKSIQRAGEYTTKTNPDDRKKDEANTREHFRNLGPLIRNPSENVLSLNTFHFPFVGGA